MMARLQWYLDPSSPHQLKKMSKLDPLWQNFLDPRMISIMLGHSETPSNDVSLAGRLSTKEVIMCAYVSMRAYKIENGINK